LLAGFDVLLLAPLFKKVVGKVDASPSILLLLARPFVYTKMARRFAILALQPWMAIRKVHHL
jgi:hypothetical protein